MRWTSRSWLEGVLVVLLFGLLFMHHAPSPGEHMHGPAADPPAAMAMTESSAAGCPCPVTGHEAPPPGGGSGPEPTVLLHLCLAVLAAVGGALAAGLVLGRAPTAPPGAGISSAGRRTGLEHLRPPVPVPRRLATLCVLRR